MFWLFSSSVSCFILRSKSTFPSKFSRLTYSNQTPLPQPPPLREYQEQCIQAILSSISQGNRRIAVSLPTGSGKTLIYTNLINRVHNHHQRFQTLVLSHRLELIYQAAVACRQINPHLKLDIEMASSHACPSSSNIVLASHQSLSKCNRLSRFNPANVKLIIIDEAHHALAPNYQKILNYFNLLDINQSPNSSPVLLGLSASFVSDDQPTSLNRIFDTVAYSMSLPDMLQLKYLCNVKFTSLTLPNLISTLPKSPAIKQPLHLINSQTSHEIVVRTWLKLAQDRRSTLVFCANVDHTQALTQEFLRRGINAHFVIARTSYHERSTLLQSFQRNEFPVLLNCGVLTEGVDLPCVDCILLLRPTNTTSSLLQIIGRGLRLYPGKDDCLVIDFVSSIDKAVFSFKPLNLQTSIVPSPQSPLRHSSLASTEATKLPRRSKSSPSLPYANLENLTLGFAHYSSFQDLLHRTLDNSYIRSLSKFAWVNVKFDKFVLACPNTGFLTIKMVHDECVLTFTAKLRKTEGEKVSLTYTRARIIHTSSSLESVIQFADNFATRKFPPNFISKNLPWRQLPASPSQISFLQKFNLSELSPCHSNTSTHCSDDSSVRYSLSKGCAADLITVIRFGGLRHLRQFLSSSHRNNKCVKQHGTPSQFNNS